jgi:parvulin-like peptidyl-prolyl isomerase
MKVGDISQVVQVPNGFAVFKLEANVESTTLPFESAKGAIADKLGQEKVRGEMRKYMTRLRAQAIIDWKDPELKKAYDAGVSGEPTF